MDAMDQTPIENDEGLESFAIAWANVLIDLNDKPQQCSRNELKSCMLFAVGWLLLRCAERKSDALLLDNPTRKLPPGAFERSSNRLPAPNGHAFRFRRSGFLLTGLGNDLFRLETQVNHRLGE